MGITIVIICISILLGVFIFSSLFPFLWAMKNPLTPTLGNILNPEEKKDKELYIDDISPAHSLAIFNGMFEIDKPSSSSAQKSSSVVLPPPSSEEGILINENDQITLGVVE